jgi:hypothetical protein
MLQSVLSAPDSRPWRVDADHPHCRHPRLRITPLEVETPAHAVSDRGLAQSSQALVRRLGHLGHLAELVEGDELTVDSPHASFTLRVLTQA